MAENHPDDLDALMDDTAADEPEAAQESAGADGVQGPSGESEKDTLENAQLQAQGSAPAENNVAIGAPASAKVKDERSKLEADLKDARNAMGELLAWKEDLRLLAMHHNTLGPYYDNWTKEANLFFRRLVIINKRFESLRKKKRA